MLIRYFKSSFLGQYILLFILLLLLWGPSFFQPFTLQAYENTSPLWNLIVNLLVNFPIMAMALSALLSYFTGLTINSVLANHGLIGKNSLLGAYFYVLLIASSFHFHQLNPIILVNFLMALLLYYLFQLYVLRKAYKVAFSVGFLISIAFLIYPPAIFLFLPMYLIFMTMGNISWREWFIPLIAFLLPVLYVAVYYFWIGNIENLFETLVKDISNFKIFHFRFDALNWVKVAIIIPVFLWSFLKSLAGLSSKNIDIRKKAFALLHLFVFSSLIFLFVVFPYRQFSLLFPPVAAFLAFYLDNHKSSLKYDWAFIVVVLVSLIDNYHILELF